MNVSVCRGETCRSVTVFMRRYLHMSLYTYNNHLVWVCVKKHPSCFSSKIHWNGSDPIALMFPKDIMFILNGLCRALVISSIRFDTSSISDHLFMCMPHTATHINVQHKNSKLLCRVVTRIRIQLFEGSRFVARYELKSYSNSNFVRLVNYPL